VVFRLQCLACRRLLVGLIGGNHFTKYSDGAVVALACLAGQSISYNVIIENRHTVGLLLFKFSRHVTGTEQSLFFSLNRPKDNLTGAGVGGKDAGEFDDHGNTRSIVVGPRRHAFGIHDVAVAGVEMTGDQNDARVSRIRSLQSGDDILHNNWAGNTWRTRAWFDLKW